MEERIQKLLALAGFGSRRACEAMIEEGRVTVNGRLVHLGGRADPDRDRIELDGVAVDVGQRTVVYALHKPAGVVTTAADPKGRPTVVALVPPEPRVFPVGRLDVDTEGLLLLTNDGALANAIAHPRHGVDKTYLVEAKGRLGPRDLGRLRRGVEMPDGVTAPAQVRPRGQAGGRSVFEITIHEGRNRQVRRMVEAVGADIERLVRTKIGSVELGRLRAGQWRKLGPLEVDGLRRLTRAPRPS